MTRSQYFPAFDTTAVVWSTARVLTLARSRLFLNGETRNTANHYRKFTAFAFVGLLTSHFGTQ